MNDDAVAVGLVDAPTEKELFKALWAWAEERESAGDPDGADCLRWCAQTRRAPLGWVEGATGTDKPGLMPILAETATPEVKRTCMRWGWWSPDEMTRPSFSTDHSVVPVELWDTITSLPLGNVAPCTMHDSIPAAYKVLMKAWGLAKDAGWDAKQCPMTQHFTKLFSQQEGT